MAQIDASIPLGIRPPQIRDPLEVYGNALNVQALQQRNALSQRQMQQEDAARAQAMADQEVLRAYFQSGPGEQNLNALRSRPQLFTAEQERLAKLAKDRADTEGKKATTDKTQNEVRASQFMQIAQTMRNVRDQASYDGAMELVASLFGPDMVKKLPPQYSPETVQKMLDGAVTQANAMQNETTRRGQDMTDSRTRAEGAANRAVTMRGQNQVDARARDAAAAGGKPPPGYRFTPDGNLEAIPGGPADIKAGELGAKRAKAQEAAVAQADRIIAKVDQAISNVGPMSAGVGATISNAVPLMSRVTNTRNLEADLQTIKANLGFAELQAMRDASPTGGALGQVAVQELVALQSTVAALDQEQSPEQLTARLQEIRKHYENWKAAVEESRGGKPAAPKPAGGGGAGWGIRRID